MIDMSALLNQQGQLFLLLAVGLLFKRWGVVDDGFQKGLTDFLIKLILPCNIIYFFQMEFNQEILRQTSAILAVSTVIQLVCWLLAMTLYRRQAPEKRSALQYATLCSNGACLGAPLVEGIFGSQGMLLYSVYLVPQRVAMWTVGLSFFNQKNGQRQWKKILLNPCIDAVVIGMVLLVTQWRLPAVLGGTIKTFSSCNMGAAMFLIGMICADVRWRDFLDRDILYYCVIRLVLIPALTIAGCRLARMDGLVTGVALVLAAMPAGGTTAILAAKYSDSAHFAAGCVTVSTLLSLIATPLWCMTL